MTDTIITSDTTSLPVDSPAKASEPLVSATTLEVVASLAPVLGRLAPAAYNIDVTPHQIRVQGSDGSLDELIKVLGLTYANSRVDTETQRRFTDYTGRAFAPWQSVRVWAVVVEDAPAQLPADCDSADHEAATA
ncbi:hypothetical protein [Phycicoccus sp. 3266]|uniref:hypothetical protein n=1 Tax=Phycicoccus sp. 3266 TaxID=2817751 RepID=UPI00285C73FC|nr:hypothetical protein [Phycicoccus sp. 3266]MDR6861928.1 hypothetical protein [Phycicoccus sp. 3266]